MVEDVDELILSALSKNARQDVREIWDFLRGHGHNLTEEEIDSRIIKLEEEGVIAGYTIFVDLKKLRRLTMRVARYVQNIAASPKKDRRLEEISGRRAIRDFLRPY
jgi:DNA-binding Lrp family transcriptional regulator